MNEQSNQNASSVGPAALRQVPRTGVIYVMNEARLKGYSPRDPAWSNLGQGQPEIGVLEHAPRRVDDISVLEADLEYAPVAGLHALREAVAAHYNRTYRQKKSSKYTWRNVSVSSGGRAALTRIAASLGPINLGHFLPDYTAYEELLSVFRLFSPIPILLDPAQGYRFSAAQLEEEVLGRGLSALLLSNPCNPTGKLLEGSQMSEWLDVCRRLDCTLLIDEFYSHYIWSNSIPNAHSRSAAEFVDNVDEDPVIIVDGLTKNWRYPGWRISWTLGPVAAIEAVSSAGSFLDGGGSRPLQRAAIPLLEQSHTNAETAAIQRVFGEKRAFMLKQLRAMGVRVENDPMGTFYVWGDVSRLPPGLSDGMQFFRKALEYRVITVPGVFFDVNPGRRRAERPSRFRHYVRFSFGPSMESLTSGLKRLSRMISDATHVAEP